MRALALAAVLLGCQRDSPSRPAGKLELIETHAGPIVPFIAAEVARAHRDHAQVLVYEGAVWCEPCGRFHQAATAGQLDAEFPRLRVLVFDADHDDDELARAGYHSDYIPLFAIPDDDGTASGKQVAGGTKGGDAVSKLAPRLHQLLAGS